MGCVDVINGVLLHSLITYPCHRKTLVSRIAANVFDN